MKKIFFILCSFMLLLEASNPIAVFETSKGNFEVELRPDLAPKAVENFVTHSKNGYYNGVIFHRVIKNFMIQTGDPDGTGRGGESIWKKDFEDEFSPKALFDKPGVLAMANRGKNTNGSQFFVTTVPTYWLNGRHSIFGYVTKGYEIVKKIENAPTAGRSGGDKPLSEIKIISITIK